jgi:uncharacterized protein YjbI with pentapeptide repeats
LDRACRCSEQSQYKTILGLVGATDHPCTAGSWRFYFNRQARKAELLLAEDRIKENALQIYLNRMSELILDRKLRESKLGDVVQYSARLQTLTVLRSLDGNRKGQVVRFLYDAGLIGNVEEPVAGKWRILEAIIDMRGAELNGISKLGSLRGVNLTGTFLTSANLSFSDWEFAKLSYAHLQYANLTNTNLCEANLSATDLTNTNLTQTALFGANLSSATGWTNEQLAQAESLVGATLPGGTKMTEEQWEEFKKRYG